MVHLRRGDDLMGAPQQILLANIAGDFLLLVQGAVGVINGYSADPGVGLFGSITPTEYQGIPVYSVLSRASNFDFRIELVSLSSLGQDFFSDIYVRDDIGNFRQFLSAAASFSHVGDSNVWAWGDGSNPVWNSAKPPPGLPKTMRII